MPLSLKAFASAAERRSCHGFEGRNISHHLSVHGFLWASKGFAYPPWLYEEDCTRSQATERAQGVRFQADMTRLWTERKTPSGTPALSARRGVSSSGTCQLPQPGLRPFVPSPSDSSADSTETCQCSVAVYKFRVFARTDGSSVGSLTFNLLMMQYCGRFGRVLACENFKTGPRRGEMTELFKCSM
ncbi:uncharacterized protein LOC125457933 isoform X3 [Stegostoma tigrinum]|uniref:uncharacterized protein LOC125457933 isoform X3 n=1 Tax=Stegostoma tigrinum TaxID=3053191 RepID=UPI00202B1CFF|nr:uncharacterized protein LOC125457933 isoform X3 [Stegostoma tigrinum]